MPLAYTSANSKNITNLINSEELILTFGNDLITSSQHISQFRIITNIGKH